MSEIFAPGIVTEDGRTIYPTGLEWILAFALNGCQWAIDALPEAIENAKRQEIEKTLGGGI